MQLRWLKVSDFKVGVLTRLAAGDETAHGQIASGHFRNRFPGGMTNASRKRKGRLPTY
jgi:hypothetical protein